MRTRTIFAALAAVVVALLAFPGSSGAAGGSRCRTSRPGCGVGAEPICLCPSKQASDSECRWICGALG